MTLKSNSRKILGLGGTAQLDKPEIRICRRVDSWLYNRRPPVAALDFVLQQHQTVKHGFRSG